MEITSPDAFFRRHVGEAARCVEHDLGGAFFGPEQGRWQLEQLNLFQHLVQTTTLFFTNAHAAHQGSEGFVS